MSPTNASVETYDECSVENWEDRCQIGKMMASASMRGPQLHYNEGCEDVDRAPWRVQDGIYRVRDFRTPQRDQWRVLKIRQKQSLGGRLPLSPANAPKQAGNTRATCRGIVDTSPSAHKRMTGNYLLDVFGRPGFLAKATNHLGLRACVLDAKFGTRCDMTRPSVVIANLLHRARMLWLLEHWCESWLWEVPKIQILAAQPRTAWALAVFLFFWISVQKSELYFWLGTWTAESCTVLLASWDRRSLQLDWRETCSSHTRQPSLSFTLAMIPDMNARRFQRTHPLSGMGSSLNASKDVGVEVTDLALNSWIRTLDGPSVYCSGWFTSHWSRT